MTSSPPDAVLDRFMVEYQQFHDLDPKRQRVQRKTLEKFRDFLSGRPLSEATADDLRSFMQEMLGRGLAPTSVRTYGNHIRPFFTWGWEAGIFDAETLMRVRAVRNPKGATNRAQPRPYKRTELQQFWAALDEAWPWVDRIDHWVRRFGRGFSPWTRVRRHAIRAQLQCIVILMLQGGLRREETYNLTVDDMHPDNEYLVVRGKGGKVREVPMTDTMRSTISYWLEFRRTAFVGTKLKDHGRPWLQLHTTKDRAKPMRWPRFEEYVSKNVPGGWTYHRFRHTCGTEWLRAGVPLEQVQRLLGHANISETQGYAELVNRDVGKSMSKNLAQFERATQPKGEQAA